MRATGHVALVVGWIAALVALSSWSAATPATVLGLLATVLAGALVGRWWILAVPAVPMLAGTVWTLLSTSAAEYEDDSPRTVVLFAVVLVGTLDAALIVGVALRKGWDGRRQRATRAVDAQ